MSQSVSIDQVARVARHLGSLLEHVVFLGGAVTGLLITDPAAPEVRPTDDVDAIIEVTTRLGYYKVEQELRRLGFVQRRQTGDPICRWVVADALFDIMPADGSILGFGNPWYESAIAHSNRTTLSPDLEIRVISAPYFIATKLEAFRARGNGDFLLSRDMQDVIVLLDGRPELTAEIRASDPALRSSLAETFGAYLSDEGFLEAIPGHLLPDAASQRRLALLLERMGQIAAPFAS